MAKFKKLAIISSAVLMTTAFAFGVAACEKTCEHTYEKKSDETHTWYACTQEGCDSIVGKEEIPHAHTFGETYSTDATQHWYGCSGCDVKVGAQDHENGAYVYAKTATATTKTATCEICGYETVTTFETKSFADATYGEGTEAMQVKAFADAGVYDTSIPVTWYEDFSFTTTFVQYYYKAAETGTLTLTGFDKNVMISIQDENYFSYYYDVLDNETISIPLVKDTAIMLMFSADNSLFEGIDEVDSVEAAAAITPYANSVVFEFEAGNAKALSAGETEIALSNYAFYTYTVTGEDTVSISVESTNSSVAIALNDEARTQLYGGSTYIAVEAGDILTFCLTNYIEDSILFTTLTIEELDEAPQTGAQATPYIIDQAGETFTDLEFPMGNWGPDAIYFSYTATANGTLSWVVEGGSVNEVLQDDGNWSDFNPMSNPNQFTVVAGITYTILLNPASLEAPPVSPVFTFTAANA